MDKQIDIRLIDRLLDKQNEDVYKKKMDRKIDG